MGCKRVLWVLICCAASLLPCAPAFGQATGSLFGTVSDPSGALVPAAVVTATSQGTGIQRETRTDADGHYVLPLLPIGTFTLKVIASGFQPVQQKDLVLQVDENREVDFTLATATVQQTIEVSGTPVAVETSN